MGGDIYSPYAVAESETVAWKPGEEMAAAAFIGAAIYIVIDLNVGIFRIFKGRRGLYYWSMQLGTLFCPVDAFGVILKFLAPDTKHIWGLFYFSVAGQSMRQLNFSYYTLDYIL